MIAKYSYTANPDKPGGFEELTIKQGEKLWFVEKHPYNPHWIKVKTENGATGFAPTSYTMVRMYYFYTLTAGHEGCPGFMRVAQDL